MEGWTQERRMRMIQRGSCSSSLDRLHRSSRTQRLAFTHLSFSTRLRQIFKLFKLKSSVLNLCEKLRALCLPKRCDAGA